MGGRFIPKACHASAILCLLIVLFSIGGVAWPHNIAFHGAGRTRIVLHWDGWGITLGRAWYVDSTQGVAEFSERSVTLYFWIVIPLLALPPIIRYRIQIRRMLHRCLRKPVVDRARCTVCGYDLRATPDRCPECGTFQPSWRAANEIEFRDRVVDRLNALVAGQDGVAGVSSGGDPHEDSR